MHRTALSYDPCSRVESIGDILCIVGMAYSGESVCTSCTRHPGSC